MNKPKDLSYLPDFDLRDAIRSRMDVLQQLREHLADKEERLQPYLWEYARRFGHEYGIEPEPNDSLPEEWVCFDRLSGERFTVLATDERLQAKVEEYIRAGLDADSGAVAYEVDCTGPVTGSVFLSGDVVWCN